MNLITNNYLEISIIKTSKIVNQGHNYIYTLYEGLKNQ